jgi:hypothetical protein
MSRSRLYATLTVAVLTYTVARNWEPARPVPQDPGRQQERWDELLEWNRRTLGGAYEEVGKKDPRWDGPAREALERAAGLFSQDGTPAEDVYASIREAVEAGCDDPLVLYLYGRSSINSNDPGPREYGRRLKAAADAMQASDYPPLRKAIALELYGSWAASRDRPTPEGRRDAERALSAAVALLPSSAGEGDPPWIWEDQWFLILDPAIDGLRRAIGNYPEAFDRVDAALAGVPGAEARALRPQARGDFLIKYAWEARGNGFADTVSAEGFRLFTERLTEAGRVLEEAWEVSPGHSRTATLMLTVEKGVGGDRESMETWFRRALEADGNNGLACWYKLDWLDPKWHGSTKKLFAFGRACRDTGNWRARLPLILVHAHLIAAYQVGPPEYTGYFKISWVWDDIRGAYDEYLRRYPRNFRERSRYAALCYWAGQHAEADRQFRAIGENLVGDELIPVEKLKQYRSWVRGSAEELAQEKTRPAS